MITYANDPIATRTSSCHTVGALYGDGKEIIATSNLNVTSADDLDDAAQKIVKAVKGS